MSDISKHQLIKRAYEVCVAIEECGASEKLTDAAVKASALEADIDVFVDDINSKSWSIATAIIEAKAEQRELCANAIAKKAVKNCFPFALRTELVFACINATGESNDKSKND